MNRVEIKLLERADLVRRQAINSPLQQGTSELVMYFVDFAPWGASATYPVTSPILKILDSNNDDVTHGNHVATIAVTDGGTLYEVGDILTITEVGSSGDATIEVLTVAGGVILTAELVDVGYDYTAGVKATTGHTADATFTITVTAAELQVKASAVVVSDVEIQFNLENFEVGERYRVFIKGTVNALVEECWTYIDGEL